MLSITHTSKVILATCNLNQWALDFEGNLKRTIESIRIAKERGARFRTGPELELSGYSCEDHFLEMDTYLHCNQSLAELLSTDITDSILCDIGCPILHEGVRYNCRVFCLNRKIILIRPKISLADDGNYREPRYFSGYKGIDSELQTYTIPDIITKVTGQTICPFGFAIIKAYGTTIGAECCEELWTTFNPHIPMYLSGVDIISNGSGSHHQLRKLNSRVELVKGASKRGGGVYLFANHKGGDGGRLYFDGCCLICVNGDFVAQGSQFDVGDVEVITATIDINDIYSYRQGFKATQEQSSSAVIKPLQTIDISSEFTLFISNNTQSLITKAHTNTQLKFVQNIHSSLCQCKYCHVTPPLETIRYHTTQEECVLGPACWMWDYLRRSKASGFLVPLSGGADSASVAAIIHVMSHLAINAANNGDKIVIDDLQRLLNLPNNLENIKNNNNNNNDNNNNNEHDNNPNTQEHLYSTSTLTNKILHTVYMGTINSTNTTRNRAEMLANEISSYHKSFYIDMIVTAVVNVFSQLCGKTPRFVSQGGTNGEDLALQNIQARLRMVFAYLCAQLFPWVRGNTGFLLVVGTGNVDEALRGYMTKYDCSSADINPIGGISKGDLNKMINYVSEKYNVPTLKTIAEAPPTAELRPIIEGSGSEHSQLDEVEMGMTYKELGVFGLLRKTMRCGPVSMFLKLATMWGSFLSLSEIATKVKRFFFYYSINRHKCTTLTPSYHAENYSPDDNRFDLRPFLYNTKWTKQFETIDQLVKENEQR